MKKLLAAVVCALSLFVGSIAGSTPAEADTVTAAYTREICFWLVPPGGYDVWYLYSYRTVHLFGGPIHVTQCAFSEVGGLPPGYYNLPNCRQYVWNGNFTPYWEDYSPNYNNGPPYCW